MAAKTITVKPAGQGGDYATLNAALAGWFASYTDLTTDNGTGAPGILNVEIGGTWSAVDATAVAIPAFTTSATCYLNIYTVSPARHAGVYNTSAYILAKVNTTGLITHGACNYVYIDGLQIYEATVSGVDRNLVNITTALTNGGNNVRYSNCILRGANGASRQTGINVSGTYANVSIWNCIIYDIPALASCAPVMCDAGTASVIKIYSSTLIGGAWCIYVNSGTVTAKNVYGGGSLTEDFYRGGGSLAKYNCASEDQSADDTGTGETQSNCVAAAVLIDTDTFVNVTAGSQDFHLAADGLSPLQAAGVDTSGDAAPMNFTTDVDGDTRDATWDIGADAAVGAAEVDITAIQAILTDTLDQPTPVVSGSAVDAPNHIAATASQLGPIIGILNERDTVGAHVSPTVIMGW